MSKGTPLQAKVISDIDTTKCVSNVYNLASLQSKKDCAKFRNDVIGYCLEWERTVLGRMDNELAKSKELLGTKLHYEDKLPSLRKKVYDCESKGKKVPHSIIDKLNRNESKLKIAKNEYENHAFELVIQLEEAIICSWKDLFPLLQYMMTWESERANTENKIFKNLHSSLLRELTDQFDEIKDYKAVRMSKVSDDSDYYDDNNDYESVHMGPDDDDDSESMSSKVSRRKSSKIIHQKVVAEGFEDFAKYHNDDNDDDDDDNNRNMQEQQQTTNESTIVNKQKQKTEPVIMTTLGSGRISKK
jgi:hypothetical protein